MGRKKSSTAVVVCGGNHKWGPLALEIASRLDREKTAEFLSRHYIGLQAGSTMADNLLVLDGCGYHCTKWAMEDAGFSDYEHLVLTDLDFLHANDYSWSEEDVEQILSLCRKLLLHKNPI